MTHIDFLPQRYRDQSLQDRARLWHLGLVCMLGGVLAIAALYQFGVRQSVQMEFSEVQAEGNAAQAKIQRVAELQALVKSEAADAELLTWLKHPWPRTQLLGAISEHVPPEVLLEELRLDHEDPLRNAPVPVTEVKPATAAPKLSAPAMDLAKLRGVHDGKVSYVLIIGQTQDTAALHTFLAKIGSVGLYSKAELLSIETAAEQQAATRFKARLTIRRGFGQPGGPLVAWQEPSLKAWHCLTDAKASSGDAAVEPRPSSSGTVPLAGKPAGQEPKR